VTAIAASVVVVATAAAQQKMPETTKESIKGDSSHVTQRLEGTVQYEQGNTLVVRMSSGEIREFNVPDSQKFNIDGKEVTVHDLKPGTKLQATVTTTTTSVTDRTTTVGTGKVWYVAGNNVILTLPNGENRMYKVEEHYKFNIGGNKDATVFDLKKGMTVSAQRITEEPRVEIATNTVVTGQAPPPPAPKPVVARTPPPTPAPAPREVAQATPPPARPAPAPEPVQVAQATPPPAPAAAPAAELPNTGSQLPLIGLLGLVFTIAGLSLKRIGFSGSR
jgi:hypothetical protein